MPEHTSTSTLNVDANEIHKFEQMANRWWDPQGEFKPLHQMNPVRSNYIDKHCPVRNLTVVDIGCGGGLLSEGLAQRGGHVSGIDMAEAPLEVARLHALESGLTIHYQHSTAESFSESHAEQFDLVTCLEMLEHVPDPASTISACAALAKPGASLVFSTINRNAKAYAFAILGAEYVMKLLPKGTHEYAKFIQPAELCHWIRSAGLVVDDVCGIRFDLLQQKFKLSPNDTSVNYLVHARKPTY